MDEDFEFPEDVERCPRCGVATGAYGPQSCPEPECVEARRNESVDKVVDPS